MAAEESNPRCSASRSITIAIRHPHPIATPSLRPAAALIGVIAIALALTLLRDGRTSARAQDGANGDPRRAAPAQKPASTPEIAKLIEIFGTARIPNRTLEPEKDMQGFVPTEYAGDSEPLELLQEL